MKAIALAVLLLVSISFLGCVQPSEETPSDAPRLEEQPFGSEDEALLALEQELDGVDDLSLSELENALQE